MSNVVAEFAAGYDNFLRNLIDAVNGKPEKMLEFLQSLGGHPHPGYVDLSQMSPSTRGNLTRLERENPEMHMILSQISPAYAAIQNRRKMDEAILMQPGDGNTRMPAEQCIQRVFGSQAAQIYKQSQNVAGSIMQGVGAAAGFPEHVAKQIDHLVQDAQRIMEKVGKLIELFKQIVDFITKIEPHLEEWLSYIIKDIVPIMKMMDELVMKPYLQACRDSKRFMDDLMKEVEEDRTAVDSTIPKIVGPNLDMRKMQGISSALGVPILGPCVWKPQIDALVTARYIARQGRGFIDDYAMMQAAQGFPNAMPVAGAMLGAASGVAAAAARIPTWFLVND